MTLRRLTLQGVQIRQHLIDLLVGKYPSICGHLGASITDHLANTVIIGWSSARQLRLLVHSFETGALKSPRGVGFVTTGATVIEDVSSGRLLGVQPKLRVRFAALGFTACQRNAQQER